MVNLAPKVSPPVKATSTMRAAALKAACPEGYSGKRRGDHVGCLVGPPLPARDGAVALVGASEELTGLPRQRSRTAVVGRRKSHWYLAAQAGTLATGGCRSVTSGAPTSCSGSCRWRGR
jgi:hypothetical protein